jgi:hypothetical protein
LYAIKFIIFFNSCKFFLQEQFVSDCVLNHIFFIQTQCSNLIEKNIYLRMQQNDQTQNQLNIELSEEMAEGIYSNLAIITHSNAEFIVDFINVMPNAPKARVKSRIVLTPQHAKRLMKALLENVQKFEQANGTIKDVEPVSIPMQFGGPQAQA